MPKVTQPVIGRVGPTPGCSLRHFRAAVVLPIQVSHSEDCVTDRPRTLASRGQVSEEKGEEEEVVGGKGHAQVEILSFFQ